MHSVQRTYVSTMSITCKAAACSHCNASALACSSVRLQAWPPRPCPHAACPRASGGCSDTRRARERVRGALQELMSVFAAPVAVAAAAVAAAVAADLPGAAFVICFIFAYEEGYWVVCVPFLPREYLLVPVRCSLRAHVPCVTRSSPALRFRALAHLHPCS